MILAIWIVTTLLVALWSLAAWGVHAVLHVDAAWVTRIEPWLHRVPFADWLERWFPAWMDVAHAALDVLQATVAWLVGAAPVLVWVVWALGALGLCLVAGVLTLVVTLVRKSTTPPAAPPAAA